MGTGPLRSALIIGYGSIGRRHREVLAALFPAASIAVVSRHAEALPGFYRSIDEVPRIDDFDYFVIASRTLEHHSDLAALEARVAGKTILVEKPLFDVPREFSGGRNAVFVGYNLRFHPVLAELARQLRSRDILAFAAHVGQYLPTWRPGADYTASYSASKAQGGGVLLDLSHEVDYLHWLCGAPAELKAIDRKISALEIDSDDYATAIGITDRGVIFNLTMDYLSREPKRSIHVQCRGSTFYCDLIKNALYEVSDDGGRREFPFGPLERNASYRAMHEDVLAGGGVSATLRSGMEVMETIARMRRSSAGDWHG